MRVLITTDPVGGVWTFTAALCRQLCVEHEVCLVSFGGALSADQRLWVREMEASPAFCFHASNAPLEWMQDNHAAYEAGARLLTSVAARFLPDLLHLNQFCWGALPRVGALDVPRLGTAHSDVLSWATAAEPAALVPSAWLTRYCELVQDGLAGCDVLVAPTQWMLSALEENFALPPDQRVILNGLTLAPPVGVQRKRQAATAGRLWDKGKGLDLLTRFDTPFPILVAGDGPASSSALIFLGQVGHADLLQLFSASTFYICTSLYEPFGLAPLEAALCGCTLLLRDLPSLREIWGDAALYFADAASLEVLLSSENTDASASTERARQLTGERMAGSYVACYQSVEVAACA